MSFPIFFRHLMSARLRSLRNGLRLNPFQIFNPVEIGIIAVNLFHLVFFHEGDIESIGKAQVKNQPTTYFLREISSATDFSNCARTREKFSGRRCGLTAPKPAKRREENCFIFTVSFPSSETSLSREFCLRVRCIEICVFLFLVIIQ